MDNLEMKDRIAHIIRAKNLTAGDFALRLGIQPSNVSHLLSGRNNPSLDFVKKPKETFPEYNLDWIVLGVGPMTVSEPLYDTARTEAAASAPLPQEATASVDDAKPTLSHAPVEPLHLSENGSPNMALEKIILVYADRTFEVIIPR